MEKGSILLGCPGVNYRWRDPFVLDDLEWMEHPDTAARLFNTAKYSILTGVSGMVSVKLHKLA